MHIGTHIRRPHVAGTFYPGTSNAINAMLAEWSISTKDQFIPHSKGKLQALIAPHAGYIYSGPIANSAYHLLHPGQYDTVFLIGPSHFDGFEEISVYPGAGYATPFGSVAIDTEITKALSQKPFIHLSTLGHRQEHSLEVQLPFLQYYLGHDINLVPLVMREQTLDLAQKLAHAIKPFLNDRTLIVASSDLSHYYPYETANILDGKFAEVLENGDSEKLWHSIRAHEIQACGYGPILTALESTTSLRDKRKIEVLDRRNSGDTAGNRDQVVGYLSAAIYEMA